MDDLIFSRLSLGTHTLKNRIVVPPLAVFGLLDDGSDQVQEAHLTHYREMSLGGPFDYGIGDHLAGA